jgi:hypothetical protein
LRVELELVDTGANDALMERRRSGGVKVESGLDAFAAQVVRRTG